MKPFALSLLLCVATSLPALAEMYKWTDKDGSVTYSDHPPPADAQVIEKKKLGDNVIETDQVPFAAQSAAGKFPVTLYANDCGDPCSQAKDLLEKRSVPFAQKNPAASPDDAAALKRLVGKLEVPVLLVGKSKPLKGFDEAQWNGALDAADYPKAGSASAAKPITKVRAGPPNGTANQPDPGSPAMQPAPDPNAAEAPVPYPNRSPASEGPPPQPPVPAAADSKATSPLRKRQQN